MNTLNHLRLRWVMVFGLGILALVGTLVVLKVTDAAPTHAAPSLRYPSSVSSASRSH